MRLAAPVTRMTLPASSDGLLSMYFHLVGVDSFQLRLGNPARIVGPGPEDRGHRAQRAGPGADGSRAVVLRSDSGHHHRDHHSGPYHRLDRGKHAAAIVVRDVPQQLREIQHRSHGHYRARQANEKQSRAKLLHLAEDNVRRAVHNITDNHAALISVKAERPPQPVPQGAAEHQSDAGASPNVPDPFSAAFEDQLAEQAEEDLGRAATRSPPDP